VTGKKPSLAKTWVGFLWALEELSSPKVHIKRSGPPELLSLKATVWPTPASGAGANVKIATRFSFGVTAVEAVLLSHTWPLQALSVIVSDGWSTTK
jgi:hypothetical protein